MFPAAHRRDVGARDPSPYRVLWAELGRTDSWGRGRVSPQWGGGDVHVEAKVYYLGAVPADLETQGQRARSCEVSEGRGGLSGRGVRSDWGVADPAQARPTPHLIRDVQGGAGPLLRLHRLLWNPWSAPSPCSGAKRKGCLQSWDLASSLSSRAVRSQSCPRVMGREAWRVGPSTVGSW